MTRSQACTVATRGLLVTLLALPALGVSQDWPSFQAAFPSFPCADGWAGCIVEGRRMGQRSDTLPADLRVDWFDLSPTTAFSPFVTLSAYTGESQASKERIPNVVTRPPAPEPAPAPVAPAPREPVAATAPEPPTRPRSRPPSRPEPPTGGGTASPGVPDATLVAQAPPEGCVELRPLETPAMLGQLDQAQKTCLEKRVATDAKQTDKKHASLILIANEWGANEREAWESRVLEHLAEIDQSDPALCYKLALHLEQQGPPRAAEVIRWAETAMKNARRVWSGEQYTNKMYALHRLRSKAASELWYVAEQRHTKNPSPESQDAVDKYRAQAKNFSKEWYQYAGEAGKDTTHPREMCLSAAGTSDFCEAS